MAPITVKIKREPFSEFFELVTAEGHSEQLLPEEIRQWFKERGGDVIKLEDVLDYCWNFPREQTVVIANPRSKIRSKIDPQVSI